MMVYPYDGFFPCNFDRPMDPMNGEQICKKFLETIPPDQRLDIPSDNRYRLILTVVLYRWNKERQEQVVEELKPLRIRSNFSVHQCFSNPFTILIWHDLNGKSNYDYILRHKYYVKQCYQLFNPIIVRKVKPILLQLNLLPDTYDWQQDATDEQIEVHDDSKFGFEECVTYSMQWFPVECLGERDPEFWELGVRHHYCHNEHHPEFWGEKAMTWRYITEAVYDMGAMELEKKLQGNMPSQQKEQLLLISFDDRFLYRFKRTGQFKFIKKLLEVAADEFIK